jgi:electron transfer flavoprotein beta subunit
MKIQTSDDGKTLEVKRELDTGVATVKVTGPAVITTSDRILQPESVKNGVTPGGHQYAKLEVGGRYASLKGIMQAKKKPIDQVSLGDLGVDTAKSLNYTKFELPPARSGQTTFVADVADLVDKLHNTAKVI